MIDYSPHMFAGVEKTRKLAISTACLPGIERGLVSNSILGSGCYNFRWHDGLRKHLPLPEPVGNITSSLIKSQSCLQHVVFWVFDSPFDLDPSTLENVPGLPRSLSESSKVLKKDSHAEIDDHSNNPEAYKELIHTALRILIAEKCKESP
ncbi:hypothetical protein D5086_020465 [Populus alba]|uniref:Uncharacterized protein n=1 Tax=Populus alba TaxID=43335 RepID=A0ACC4BLS2_POPAL